MLSSRFRVAALSVAACPLMAAGHPAAALALDQVSDQAGPTQTVIVTAQHLNEERSRIQTQTGASTYTIDQTAIQSTPAAENNPLNQFLLQAPDVAQDSFGQVHVRGDHNGLQYRLNGIILPEGIAVFGQTLDARLIQSMQIIMGSLPAEYGLRTAGIVDLTTKSGALQPGGYISLYGGSHGEIQPSINYGGTSGALTYFMSGSFLRDNLGIESPDGSSNPLHDRTTQDHEFGYLEDILNEADRVSVVIGNSVDHFQIPDFAGGEPAGLGGVIGLGPCGNGRSFYPPPCAGTDIQVLTANGQYAFPSGSLDERQREATRYAIGSFQHSSGPLSLQSSLTARYSSLDFAPDPLGDLLYNGISQSAYKRDVAYAWQTDGAYRLGTHTLRAGTYLERDDLTSRTTSLVLPIDPLSGAQVSDAPLSIPDDYEKIQWIYSVYLQDEWRILPPLVVNYGVRFDRFTSFDSESATSPRVNLVWQATDSTTLHAGYSRYFSPPPFELVGGETIAKFVNTTARPTVSADDSVRAERDNYYDLGVEQRVTRDLTLGLDSYYKQASDLLDEGQFGAPIILTPFNYAHGQVYGLELTGTYGGHGPFSAYWNFATQRAIGKKIVSSEFNFSPDELAWIADHYIHVDHEQQVSASAGASYLWRGTRFSIDGILGSGLRSNLMLPQGLEVPNGDRLPYYTQINVGVMHDFSREGINGLTARVDVINVADKVYEIRNGTGVGVGAPQFGARRGFFGGLAMAF